MTSFKKIVPNCVTPGPRTTANPCQCIAVSQMDFGIHNELKQARKNCVAKLSHDFNSQM